MVRSFIFLTIGYNRGFGDKERLFWGRVFGVDIGGWVEVYYEKMGDEVSGREKSIV